MKGEKTKKLGCDVTRNPFAAFIEECVEINQFDEADSYFRKELEVEKKNEDIPSDKKSYSTLEFMNGVTTKAKDSFIVTKLKMKFLIEFIVL